ncbi:MAG: pyridoxal phosphate-dependent aminotransferase [Phycisphaerales bacterium]|nr:pyridoxal phosphate-dependent aminotransferase [Phycisphaerales bacterium]
MDIRLSNRVMAVAPSATMAMTAKAAELKARGVNVIAFAAGQPDFDTPDNVKEQAIAALRAGDTKYPSPVSGTPKLREAIRGYFERFSGLNYAPSQICATVGAKDALHLGFAALLNPGDEVIIPAPYWVSYPDQVRLCDGKPVIVTPAKGLKITADELEAAITSRTRVVVLNSPSNPSGAVYSRAELEALAGVMRKTDGVVVFADEIYHRLLLTGEPYVSFAARDGMYERTLTINGVSKTYAMTGWRLGFAAGPEPLIKAMAKLQGQTTSGPTSFVQTASVEALTGDQKAVDEMLVAFKRRGKLMADGLNALPGVTCEQPGGAFYCFPDVSGTFAKLGVNDADGFSELALERAHVATVSGVAFGAPTHARLSFATSDADIVEGLRRIGEMLR